MAIDLGNYNDVASRLAEFRAKYPDGSLQPADLSKPFEVVTIGGQTFIAVVAAAYRTPDDPRPGVGMAWETFPGKTNYTRDSELQNAETSAWGRAVVAVQAADTRRGIASAEDVRNRQAEDIDPRTGSVRTTATRPAKALAPTPAAAQLAAPPARPSPTAELGDDDPFRPFDESDMTLAGPIWARGFVAAARKGGWDAKVQGAIIHYGTGGATREPLAVLKTQTHLVRSAHAALDAGRLCESVDDEGVVTLVEVPAAGAGAGPAGGAAA